MFICEIWLLDGYFPQFCTSDMSKYGYLEVFQRVPSTSRQRESTVIVIVLSRNSSSSGGSGSSRNSKCSSTASGHFYQEFYRQKYN